MTARNSDRGAVLVAVLILAIVVSALCVTSLLMSGAESRGANAAILRDRALFVAQAGIEDQLKALNDLTSEATMSAPFNAFDKLAKTTPISRRPLMSDGLTIGEYSVSIDAVAVVGLSDRDITLTASGWVPSASDPNAVERTITAVVRVSVGRSRVFDYVYFINNWGWYYGDTIVANGNTRANGEFDFGNYAATVNGFARYDVGSDGSVSNEVDGGGVYSGWNVSNTKNVKGTTSGSDYMHSYDDYLPMPNLTDLTIYENLGKTANANITVDGKQMCDAVVGDESGEKANLYLEGKAKNHPIVLNGTVVVRGDLIIKGYVTGRGSIYVAGNVYVAGDLKYVNSPAAMPAKLDAASLAAYLKANQNADALGLFARKHIVVGDYTDSQWQSSVSSWVYDKRNGSEEDAGLDGIPNTSYGIDGVKNTADDDVLEGDDKWTVEYYKAGDDIPPGFKAGDAIPGSGEDINGDGKYTAGTKMSDFNLSTSLNKKYWEGNFPNSVPAYKNLCANNHTITQLDAAFYTNHTFAMLTLAYGQDMNFNGCLVSRNEAIVYGTKHLNFNYDPRLLMENSPYGLDLPRTWKPLQVMMWRSN